MPVPNTFASATSAIPLANLDTNFATPITLGNTAVQLGNTITTINSVTFVNATISSTNGDANIHGLTVGLGGGSVSTNTAVGYNSLATNSTGSLNVGCGYNSLYLNTSGQENTAVGVSSLVNNTTGSYNTSIGRQALAANTTASNNTAVGYQAGYSSTGEGNTYLGWQAGYATTGIGNVLIGRGTSTASAGDNYEIVIGYATSGKGSSTAFIQCNGGGAYQSNNSTLWSVTSDERLKKNIVDNTVGLTAINGIKVRNFEYRLPEEITDLDKSNAVNLVGTQLGVIAQELQQVLPDCVKTESTGVMSVDSSDVLWHLVTAVQQLSAQVTALQAKVGA